MYATGRRLAARVLALPHDRMAERRGGRDSATHVLRLGSALSIGVMPVIKSAMIPFRALAETPAEGFTRGVRAADRLAVAVRPTLLAHQLCTFSRWHRHRRFAARHHSAPGGQRSHRRQYGTALIISGAQRDDVRGQTTPATPVGVAPRVSWWKRNAAIVGVLATTGITMIAWSVMVPAWESADEPTHWAYANYIHDHAALPPYQVLPLAAYEPPLYYVLISPLAGDGLRVEQVAGGSGPRCCVVATNDLLDNAPLHLARLATAAISLLTVFFVYMAAREATGKRATGVVAAILIGLWPEFAFRGMTVSPDALVAMAGAAATYFIVRGVRRGFSRRLTIVIGITIGVATLSKLTGPTVLAGAGMAILSERGVGMGRRVGRLAPLLTAPAMIAPWLVYNQVRYGAPYAKIGAILVAAGPVHAHALFSTYFLLQFPELLLLSSIGLFGWSNIPLPVLLGAAYVLIIAAVTTGVYMIVRRNAASRRLVLVMMSIAVAAIGAAVVVNLTYQQPVGRYLLPAVGSIGVLGAMGLEQIPCWREHERAAPGILFAVMSALQIIILATVVYPAYAATS